MQPREPKQEYGNPVPIVAGFQTRWACPLGRLSRDAYALRLVYRWRLKEVCRWGPFDDRRESDCSWEKVLWFLRLAE
jgi:hypothetical protein